MGVFKKIISVLLVANPVFAQQSSATNWQEYWKEVQRRREAAVNNQTAPAVSGSVSAGQQSLNIQSSNYDSLRDASANNLHNTRKGQAATHIVMVGLAAAAAVKAGMCSSKNWSACVAAAILYMKASQARSSRDSYNGPIMTSEDNFCEFNTGSCTNGQAPKNDFGSIISNPTLSEIDTSLQDVSSRLGKEGYNVDLNTGKITGPNGEVDPNNLAALGPEEAGALAASVAEAEKNALSKVDQVKSSLTAATGFESGGGVSMGSVGIGYEDSLTAAQKDAIARAKHRKPAQVSGLSKNYNGEPIGVAADSIFSMMTRRYQLKSSQKTFFGPDLK